MEAAEIGGCAATSKLEVATQRSFKRSDKWRLLKLEVAQQR